MKNIKDEIVLKLWYDGAGDLYRRNHGLPNGHLFWARLHDNPKRRLFLYRIGSIGNLLTAIILFCLSHTIFYSYYDNDIKFFIIISNGILSFCLLFVCYWVFSSSQKLSSAIKANTNTDLIDSYRMRSLTKAIKYLIKRGHIIKDGENWKIIQK